MAGQTIRNMKSISDKTPPQARVGFDTQGNFHTKALLVEFLQGYAARMSALSRNHNIPRAQTRVAAQKSAAARKLLSQVRSRKEEELRAKPVDVFAEINSLIRADAETLGIEAEDASPDVVDPGDADDTPDE